MGIFEGMRERKEARLAASRPIDGETWAWALREHRILSRLGEGDRAELRRLCSVFLATKDFIGSGGFELEEHMLVSIAAQASLPLLRLGPAWYRGFSTIYVTADEFSITRQAALGGTYEEYEDPISGEAMLLGPVALSWRDVEASGWGEGYNVVIHEMAHKLDDTNGAIDGCPRLHRGMSLAAWGRAFGAAFEDLRAAVARPAPLRRKRGAREIDEYAAESPDEFFAVACEYFFERPSFLKGRFPEVHACLAEFFRWDPAD